MCIYNEGSWQIGNFLRFLKLHKNFFVNIVKNQKNQYLINFSAERVIQCSSGDFEQIQKSQQHVSIFFSKSTLRMDARNS